MEKLITVLVFVVIGAISTWLQKRAQEKQERENPKPPAPARPIAPRPIITPRTAAPRPTSWEDELRRLLGDEPAAPPPVRPAPVRPPTPVIVQTPPRPALAPRPVLVVPTLVAQTPPPLATLSGTAKVEQSAKDLGAMPESRRVYERASQLDTVMANRIASTPGKPVQTTSVVHRATPPEVTQVVALFKNARSARQAVIASIILGPPRAFES